MKFLSDKLVKSLSLVFFAGLTAGIDAQTFKWAPAGPIYTAGRARNMVVDKTDPSGNTLYVGSTTSGIFKSTDAGQNWAPLNDQATIRNISYLAQAADNTIYVGTGEGFLRPSQAAKAQIGTGLYKLVGNNLTLLPGSVSTGTVINRIACHPSNPNFIAITTDTGVAISFDGSTFTPVSTGTFTGMGQDVKFDGNGYLYFSIGAVAGTGGVSSTVWKSTTPLTPSSVFADITPTSAAIPSPNFGRIELAVAPSNPNVVYASCANKFKTRSSATLSGLFVTYDSGANWGTVLVGSAQLDPLGNGGTLASGDYAHTIVVNPSNSNQLFMGGYVFYTFTRTGGINASPFGTWVQAGSPYALNSQYYLHENIHDIKLIGTKYYFVTDAGIYRSIDIGSSFPSFQPFYKGLITGQFNSVSIDRFPGASGTTTSSIGTSIVPYQTYIGGTGGNGMTYFNGNYPLVSTELSYESGDIFNAEYSKLLPKAAYFSSSAGSLFRTADVTTGNSNLTDWVVNTKKQDVQSLTNSSYSISGTAFKLWENIGSHPGTPDSLVFYNDTAITRSAIPTLTTSTSFSFNIGRPQPNALIDYITVRAGTVVVAATPSQVAVNPSIGLNTKTLSIVMSPTYSLPTSTVPYSAPISSINGYTGSASSFSVILNSNNLDQIFVTLAGPLFTAQPTAAPSVTNVIDYIRITATVYYRYPAGSQIKLVDNSISTKSSTYTINTPTSGVLSWNSTLTVGSSTVPVVNPVLKLATGRSARLAMPYASGAGGGVFVYSIRVTNSPLDLNTPLSFVNVSQDKCRTDDAFGNPTTTTLNIVGKPSVLEWAKSGKYLYYATEAGTVNCLYRVSHLNTLVDSTSKGYGGKLHTNIFTYNTQSTPNPRSPYRTTLLGQFPNKITSISIPANDSIGMMLTFDDPSPTGTVVMVSTNDIRKSDAGNIVFVNRTSPSLNTSKTYCSLLEKSDSKKAYIGTDNGIFYNPDVSATGTGTWTNVDAVSTNSVNWLPKVQIFDIKQQTLDPWNCYNSGQIYVATNGRGVWTNNDYFVPMVVSVNEIPKATTENNITLFPNPTNGNVNVSFTGVNGETAKITLYDLNGRTIQTTDLGKVYSGDVNYTIETTNLASGIYIVNVTSDAGIKRVAKLIVTK